MAFKHFVICVSGYSGSGKDEFVNRIIQAYDAPKVGLADPAKRHMADVYGFSEYQLFGPSAARNSGDVRYPKPELFKHKLTMSRYSSSNPPSPEALKEGTLKEGVNYWELRGVAIIQNRNYPVISEDGEVFYLIPEGDPGYWLSPREALQKYCELMNMMYECTWIDKALNTHRMLGESVPHKGTEQMMWRYGRMEGVYADEEEIPAPSDGEAFFSCSADFRHKHEINRTRMVASPNFIPVLVRIKRPSVPEPPYDHRSETEMKTIPDSAFDFVIDNDGSIEDLHRNADLVTNTVKMDGWQSLKGRV